MAILKDTIVQGDLSVTGKIGGTFKKIQVSGQNAIEADATQDTLTVAEGTGVALTTNKDTDTLTIGVKTASTDQSGIVQLSDSTDSSSSTVAATSKAVKAAYDKASHSHDYAPSSHTHTVSAIGAASATHTHGNITTEGKLATADVVVVTNANKQIVASTTISTTELSYLDGVTSNIQTQLDSKAIAYSHGDSVPTTLDNGKLFFLHD